MRTLIGFVCLFAAATVAASDWPSCYPSASSCTTQPIEGLSASFGGCSICTPQADCFACNGLPGDLAERRGAN